jgi:hypothetical protein
MKKEQVKALLNELSEYWNIEKCRECECLQGMLVQLKLDRPELKEDVDKLTTDQFHKCLGCDPCPPAEVWVEYLKEREGGS